MDDNTPVADLGLPARTNYALYRAGYRTFGQLRALDPKRNPLGPLLVPGVGLKGESAVVYLLRSVEQSEQASAPKPDSSATGQAEEVNQPMTKDERSNELTKFLCYFIEHADGLVFYCDSAYRRHEVDPEKDCEAIIARYYAWEADQGAAAMEAQAEQAYERSWGG